MPLTKANSIVIDIPDISKSIKENAVADGIKDYIDDQLANQNTNINTELGNKANSAHTHSITDVTNLATTISTLQNSTKEFKNKIINGGCRVAQRGLGKRRIATNFLANQRIFTPVDRFILDSNNAIGSAVQQWTVTLSPTHESLAVKISEVTANGGFKLIHRISRDNIQPLTGQNISNYKNGTFSCKIENTHSQNLIAKVRLLTPVDNNTLDGETADVFDNFSDGLTLLAESANITLNSSAITDVTYTSSLLNCYGGLQIEIEITYPNVVTNNTTMYVAIAQLQFEEGSVKTDFEIPSFEEELARCLNYCEVIGSYDASEKLIGTGFVDDFVTRGTIKIDYSKKRKIPTINIVGNINDFSIFNTPSRKPSIGSITPAYIGNECALLQFDTLMQIALNPGLGHPIMCIQKINKTSYIEINAEL